MKLIEEIESKRDKKGILRKWGKFLCPFCGQIVKMVLNNGKKCQSCGCAQYKLISESQKGKNITKEVRQKISETLKGRKQSEETIYKRSLKLKGKKRTEEQIKRISEAKMGDKNPNFGKIPSIEARQKVSIGNKGKIRTEIQKNKYAEAKKGEKNPWYGKYGIEHPMYGKHHTEEIIEYLSKINSKENHPNWQNGKSFEPYGLEFNKDLKQQILTRDNYICQCPDCEGKSSKLDIHHIDYDKKNNNPENLIVLCMSCHMKSNYNRKYWTVVYQNIMEKRCNLVLF